MNSKTENIFRPIVEKFVADLNGFYHPHCSDALLVSLLLGRLDSRYSHRESDKSHADFILEGDVNAAYSVACPIFERHLEYGARAGGNGHHRAQDFSAAVQRAMEDRTKRA